MSNYKIFQCRPKNYYDLAIYQIGYEKCEKDHSFGPVKRDCYLLHFVVSGRGYYEVRGKVIPLKKGDCFLVIPDEDTYIHAEESDPYEYFWIGFRGTATLQLMEHLGFYVNNNFVFSCNENEFEVLKDYFRKTIDCERPEMDEKEYIRSLGYLYLILSMISRRDSFVPSAIRLHMDFWKEIMEYIAFHYDAPITVDGLSKRFGFHRTTIFKLFHKNTGLSPTEYILNYRLDKAMNFVKTTDMPFKSIAINCGFNSLSYFYRSFKNKFKRTPQQIRILD